MARAKLEVFEGPLVELACFAKALAHPARIRILRHLAQAGELNCMTLVAALPLSQPACSRHINELRRVGLLKSREVGTRILFRLDRAALERFCHDMNLSLHPTAPRSQGNEARETC